MQTLKQRLKKMAGKDVLKLMIVGLKKQWVNVDMNTFGMKYEGVCYGCAATNALCELLGREIQAAEVLDIDDCFDPIFIKELKAAPKLIDDFELAIDLLRTGNIHSYNVKCVMMELPNLKLQIPHPELPILSNGDWPSNLQYYIAWYESL